MMNEDKVKIEEPNKDSNDLENFLKRKKIQNSILKKLIDKTEKDLPIIKNNKS